MAVERTALVGTGAGWAVGGEMEYFAVTVAFFFCLLSPELLVSGTASGCPSQPSCAVLLLFLLL